MFSYQTTVKLHEADAAGVLFFANYFRIAHDAYESFMDSLGFELSGLISSGRFLPLIVHAEADYKKPLVAGAKVSVEIEVTRIGGGSYTLSYRLLNNDDAVVAVVTTVHATIDGSSKRPVALDKDFKNRLNQHLVDSALTG